jgi:hypothetical protein
VATIQIYAKPSNLYRYRPLGDKFEQEFRALSTGFIFCPLLGEMNDPMEGTHRVSKHFASSNERQRAVNAALADTGIASLSEVFDHEPMWAHYADQFRGICVQYNTNALLKGLPDEVAITRMMYSEQEPVLLEDRSTPVERARVCLSSKTARWANEREWRLFRDGRGQVSYGRQRAIRKIFLGMRISAVDQQRIVELGKRLQISIVKMKVEAYSIQFSPIYLPPPKKKPSIT